MNSIKEIISKIIKKIFNEFLPYYIKIDKYSMIERMTMSLSRGALNKSNLRIIDTMPNSWEFSVFSQNGEDGIIEFLLSYIKKPNKYFVEIGSSDGLENNSSYLAFAKKYSGIMLEGDYSKSRRARVYLARLNWGVKHINCIVSKENVVGLLKKECLHSDPDLFSIDIDGIDYYVVEAILKGGYRPKVICVEYNSTFGPLNSMTIMYQADFNYYKAHPSHFYFGASVKGWINLFSKFNYEFITVDSNGVNAFFVDRNQMNENFPKNIMSQGFAENYEHRARLNNTWVEQFECIKDLNYHHIQ